MNKRTIAPLIFSIALAMSLSAHAQKMKPEPKKQTTCPVMQDQTIEKSLYVDIKGKRIYVCCKGCIAQIKGNPDKYIKRLENQGVVFEKAPKMDDKKTTSQ
ncbi:MAG: hypothetical protein OES84_05870 [Kiritimatiellaceae bacterium]|nr:hypothetical protein [Kiritimatiellaceae bacterium]